MSELRHQRQPMNKVAIASATGTIIEFYDFAIFGTASALVFSAVFFPSLGQAAGVALALATFGVAFVARPFGSILFGHFGDRIGRKTTLVTTLLVMGGSTVAVGLLPTADTIGVAAPIILVILRILQGLAVGGVWAGASLLTAENAPAGKRGLYGLYPQLGPSVGFILACATFLLLSLLMTPEKFLAWGWRIPFVASFVLIVIGLFVRLSIQESSSFKELAAKGATAKFPFAEVLRYEWRSILLAAGSTTSVFALFYLGTTYLTAFGASSMHLPQSTILSLNVIGGAAFAATTILGAIASDRMGRKRVILIGNLASIAASLAVFPILIAGTSLAFLIGLVVVMAAGGIAYGPLASYLPELFRTQHRYTGAGFAYNLSVLFGAALTPLIATMLLESFGSFAIGIYLAFVSIISLLCLLGTSETRQATMADAIDQIDSSAPAPTPKSTR